jgi:hypothetical protein
MVPQKGKGLVYKNKPRDIVEDLLISTHLAVIPQVSLRGPSSVPRADKNQDRRVTCHVTLGCLHTATITC